MTGVGIKVKERPMLFSGPMVTAILQGNKTQTRRVIKPQPESGPGMDCVRLRFKRRDGSICADFASCDEMCRIYCPHGEPGERLWVREQLIRPDGDSWLYAADRQPVMVAREYETAMLVWAHHKEQDYCPSIHMPRWASRITLEITDVRVERVQDISEADAKAEGCRAVDIATGRECILSPELGSYRLHFQSPWDQINGKRPGCAWPDNPWVWALSFKVLENRNA